jgi:biofilm PGA synthesis N-glycosyltransferase PgaC
MIFVIIVIWLFLGFMAFGPAAFIFLYMKKSSNGPWPVKIDSEYRPKLSILVPTYNESSIMLLKLNNLSHLKYPKELLEIIVVDSNSSDNTSEIAERFSHKNSELKIRVLVEKERKGKSFALNYALDHCNGDIVIISDADCFWPFDILEKAMPYLVDPTVGSIGGPKILLNSNQTWITKLEEDYLRSSSCLRLGESKIGSTVFLEGGFSAFKKTAFSKFDPYGTGSDDMGTAISVIENNLRTIHVPEAFFYSSFPATLRNKLGIKLRRSNQLLRVFIKYANLLRKRKIRKTKKTIVPNILLFLFSPIAFTVFLGLSILLVVSFPIILLTLVFLAVPKVRFYFYEILESNFVLCAAMCGIFVGRNFFVWSKPEDRACLTEEELSRLNLL